MENVLEVGYFRLAREESLKSDYRIRVGAVLAGKRPTVRGFNKIKTHPRFANPDLHTKLSIHAEIACLIKTHTDFVGDTIYVYREDKDGVPAMSRPCPACLAELKKYGIKKIFYTIGHPPYWADERI